jgi:hypothetical protein
MNKTTLTILSIFGCLGILLIFCCILIFGYLFINESNKISTTSTTNLEKIDNSNYTFYYPKSFISAKEYTESANIIYFYGGDNGSSITLETNNEKLDSKSCNKLWNDVQDYDEVPGFSVKSKGSNKYSQSGDIQTCTFNYTLDTDRGDINFEYKVITNTKSNNSYVITILFNKDDRYYDDLSRSLNAFIVK